jgi:signal transduction histidine kinase
VAIGFLVAAELEAGFAHGTSTANASTYLSAGAITLALAWRRRAPLIAVGVATAALVAQAPLEDGLAEMSATWIALLFLLGSIGFNAELRPAIASLAITIGGYWIAAAIAAPGESSDWYFTPAVMAGAWALGRAFRKRVLVARSLEDRAERLEREQEHRARLAIADERSRIARELHDIVAHNVSTMIIQAGAGGRVVQRDPARAGDAFAAIEKAGRQALAEMRRLLGILRTDREGLSLAPQPSLTQLDELLDRVREAGLPVELTIVGEPRGLAPGVDVTAYRIIQEGLTNAIKHAGKTQAQVVVRYGEHDLGIEILDDGQGSNGAAAGAADGHGLIGMRERVALYRGSLETGTRKEGGYAVHANLPIEPSPS